jgi:molybdopterin-guanine dinucleotide biosynthesis protein A
VPGPASYAVVVLAGGTSRRMGGGDKTALDLGAGRSVLGHLVRALGPSVPLVIVGPPRALEREVLWARESPTGGGPLAGLAAGLAALDTRPGSADWVVALAGDQPFAAEAVPELLAAAGGADPEVNAVVGTDVDGRLQPLLAAYRRAVLRDRLSGPATGSSMHSLLDRLVVRTVTLPARALLDVDDPAALAAARRAMGAVEPR